MQSTWELGNTGTQTYVIQQDDTDIVHSLPTQQTMERSAGKHLLNITQRIFQMYCSLDFNKNALSEHQMRQQLTQ